MIQRILGGRVTRHPVSPMPHSSIFDRARSRFRDVLGNEVGAVATQRKKKGRVDVGLVPFSMASHQYTEPFMDQTVTVGANLQNIGPVDVPARGYIRHVYLLITASGGSLGTGVLSQDSPWNVFDEVTLLDVNGAPLYGSGMRGFDTFLANLYGGYSFFQDPRQAPDFASGIGFQFGVRIPVEIHESTGLGSLANQNSSSNYKLRLGINPSSVLFSTPPTTPPNVRIRGFVEGWTQPSDVDLDGSPQAQSPPFHETAQYWSKVEKQVVAGDNTIRVDRMGNLVRNLLFVLRVSGSRSTTNFPDPFTIEWDSRQQHRISRYHLRHLAAEKVLVQGAITTQFPEGVFGLLLDHDVLGHQGGGTPELWYPTVQATRFEVRGNFGAAGVLDILVNDIAPAEVNPAERYDETSKTGFTPNRDDA